MIRFKRLFVRLIAPWRTIRRLERDNKRLSNALENPLLTGIELGRERGIEVTKKTSPLWEIMHGAYRASSGTVMDISGSEVLPGPEKNEYAAMMLAIADEVERRGDLDLDLDPGETSDWLRAEACAIMEADSLKCP